MGKRHGEANRPMAAHAEVSDIVEEDDAGRARRVMRFAKERADERVVAARLVDGEAAEMIELTGEASEPFSKRTAPNGGPPSTITRVGSPSVWESMTRIALSPLRRARKRTRRGTSRTAASQDSPAMGSGRRKR